MCVLSSPPLQCELQSAAEQSIVVEVRSEILQHQDPSDALFARLSRFRTEIHPLQVCPVCGIDPLNWPVRGVFTVYHFALCVSLKKWERFPPRQTQVPLM